MVAVPILATPDGQGEGWHSLQEEPTVQVLHTTVLLSLSTSGASTEDNILCYWNNRRINV